ncbi:MAG: T9SS type A sorting domain-containing protein [Chitinophagales bacterium]|nr:T9SS type A sorting domain-containing protein [Chitinophagales bacterium]
MRCFITTTLFILFALIADAQYVFHTLDMRKKIPSTFFRTFDYQLLNGNFYMVANPNGGTHPWISDGSTLGTSQLANAGSSYQVMISDDKPIIKNSTGTELTLFEYYYATSSIAQYQIWITDGTTTGTKRLTTTTNFKYQTHKLAFKNKFYFTATDTTYGEELWESDGTTAGTKLFADLVPGKASSGAAPVYADGTRMFLYVFTPTTGGELWCTDGTIAGTYMVKDINPGSAGINNTFGGTGYILKLHNIYYFWANNGTNGWELWRTDATPSGTYMVKDIVPGSGSCRFQTGYAVANNLLFFGVDDGVHGTELWATDGTVAGTRMIKEINTAKALARTNASPNYFTVYNGEVYFSADDSIHGAELWKTNGEASGTVMVKDICANGSSTPKYLHVYKKHLFFTADNPCGANGEGKTREIYYTDGTAAGTVMIKPLTATIAGGAVNTSGFFEYQGRLFFNAAYAGGKDDLWYIGDTILPAITNIEQIAIEETTLYPNPAHHNFTIKTTTAFKTGSVTLTDITGRVVKTEKLYNNEQTISLQGIAPGIYIADVWLDDKRSTQKLVVE